jgi:hypothetical protein
MLCVFVYVLVWLVVWLFVVSEIVKWLLIDLDVYVSNFPLLAYLVIKEFINLDHVNLFYGGTREM